MLGKVAVRLVGSLALVGAGYGVGTFLNRRHAPVAVGDAARLQTVIAHERAKGNAVTEADVAPGRPAALELPAGTFAVFAAVPSTPDAGVALDGGVAAGRVALTRFGKNALANAGLGPRWQGRLTVRLAAGAPAHLAFFSAPRPK